MRKIQWAFGLVLAIAAVGCSKSGEKSGEGAAASGGQAADGFTAVPNISGLSAKIPDRMKPNGIGGAAGFHAKDGAPISVMITEVPADDASRTIDDAKHSAEEMLFKKWVKSEKTADGWVLTWEGERLDDKKEPTYSFEVRTKAGERLVKCYGSAESTTDVDAAVEVCKSLKATG
jgi:hypothetical protein